MLYSMPNTLALAAGADLPQSPALMSWYSRGIWKDLSMRRPKGVNWSRSSLRMSSPRTWRLKRHVFHLIAVSPKTR